ncbi:WD repeat-containing protein 19 isoform X2 [Planococcus citri]
MSKNHRDKLTDIALSVTIGRVASCGDNCIKVHEISSLTETLAVVTIDDDSGIEKLAWSEDGQLLAAATTYGSVVMYLSKLPMLASAYLNYICVLTSLSQITIYLHSLEKGSQPESIIMSTDIEPSFLCIGPYHLAVGMNNRIWFYDLDNNKEDDNVKPVLKMPKILGDKEYLGNVTSVCLNAEYASVLFEGRIHLHQIDASSNPNNENEMQIFPDENENMRITSQWLTSEFLIYGTDAGHIRYFCIEDWNLAIDYQHSEPIKSVYPNPDGVRCVFIDEKNNGHFYNPVNDTVLKIPRFPTGAAGAVWEISHNERQVFVIYDSKTVYSYVYIRDSIDGPTVNHIGETKLPNSHMPLLLNQGELISESPNGKISHLLLSTHLVSASLVKKDQRTSLEQNLNKHLDLLRFSEAWNLCRVIDTKECWLKLAKAALDNLNIEKAIDVYSELQDVGMVMSLKSLKYVEDKKSLAGHICKFLGNFDKAQELYLESNDPVEALYMRQDLLQWDIAHQLAATLAPEQIPRICKEYGQQLELTGRHHEALSYYEQALQNEETLDEKHVLSCYAGIARASINCGDYQRGLKIAMGPKSSKQLLNECGELLEHAKKLNEAALVYEQAENFNQAASCFIRLKNWTKIGTLLPRVTSGKIHGQFGKAMEAMGNYKRAASAYKTARDYDNMIRITLDRLNDPQEAVKIVQDTRSVEGAKMVAKHFQKVGDFVSAVKFLIMSACYEDAFKLARDHNQLELYGELLIDETSDGEVQTEFLALASHFENESNSLLAGKYFYFGKQYRKAVKYLLMAAKESPENEEALSLAIDVVAASHDDSLTNQVIELLLGEVDGEARDPKFIFRLYMAKREYMEAAKTAVIIAQEEQISGNYRQAHDILFTMCCELKLNDLKVSSEMMSSLMLLHSYILVRLHVKRGDHVKAAVLLVRVADNISKFPAHAVPILTSTVIECYRANMKLSAFNFASILMKPEYRQQIDEKYKKKIEGIIRKAPRGDQLADEIRLEMSPCPYCDRLLPCTDLNCKSCQSTLPFCIATGWHITKDDLTACPSCNFPALYSELLSILETSDRCPMCSETIDKSNLSTVSDIQQYLN